MLSPPCLNKTNTLFFAFPALEYIVPHMFQLCLPLFPRQMANLVVFHSTTDHGHSSVRTTQAKPSHSDPIYLISVDTLTNNYFSGITFQVKYYYRI